jgi:hypothetical protein
LHQLFSSHLTSSVTAALYREGYIAIVHDAISSYTDTIPWLVEEKNTLNCKLKPNCCDKGFLDVTSFRPLLTEFMFIFVMMFVVCQGFGCFGMAMVTILAAMIQIHARLICAKLLYLKMGGKQSE